MNSGQVMRRYYAGLIAAAIVLVGSSLAISSLANDLRVPQAIVVAAAVVPVAALLSMFWIQWRYVRKLDEYLRHLHAKALLLATAITLGAGTGWGYLEMAAEAPALQVYWLNPLFWVTYAVAYVFLARRDGTPAA